MLNKANRIAMNERIPEDTREQDPHFLRRREPFTFMLWVAAVGISLTFISLSFIYLMSLEQSPNFNLPFVFWLSTILIMTSSYTLHKANQHIKAELFERYRLMLGLTWGLGICFILMQLIGWQIMVEQGILLSSSRAGAFLYLISGLHILHIAGGLFFLTHKFFKALTLGTYVDAFIYSVNPPNQLRLKILTYYWHFVDVLWLYLFIFFLFNH